jgi:magnesium-transporting ATPase (P-type)
VTEPVFSETPRAIPSSVPVLKRTLIWGWIAAGVLAIVGGIIGYVVAGGVGALSAVLGALFAAVFLGVTAASIVIATRFDVAAFFGIVLGAWLLKFIIFLVAAVLLKNQPWINAPVLFLTMIVGIIVSLTLDVIVVSKSRMPYVSDLASRD